jgi:hypothetical protein
VRSSSRVPGKTQAKVTHGRRRGQGLRPLNEVPRSSEPVPTRPPARRSRCAGARAGPQGQPACPRDGCGEPLERQPLHFGGIGQARRRSSASSTRSALAPRAADGGSAEPPRSAGRSSFRHRRMKITSSGSLCCRSTQLLPVSDTLGRVTMQKRSSRPTATESCRGGQGASYAQSSAWTIGSSSSCKRTGAGRLGASQQRPEPAMPPCAGVCTAARR